MAAKFIFNSKRNTMSGYTRYFIPALLAVTLVTSCEGPSKTVDINTTMQKEQAALMGKNWKLEQLMGETVAGRNAAGDPFINFGADTNRLTGSTGCNSFFGSYKLTAPGKISIKQVGSTKRACPNMDVEMKYLKVLNEATNYAQEGETLILANADNVTLAKFRSAASK